MMQDRRFSQLLVMDGVQLRGFFSLWDLARLVIESPGLSLEEVTVGDVMDAVAPRITVDDGLDHALHLLQQHEALVVVSPHGPQAVLTHTDALLYLHRVARRFFLIEEIERTLRTLIRRCTPGALFDECAAGALSKKYELRNASLPSCLEDMTLEDCVSLIDNKKNYEHFKTALGQLRELARGRLGSVVRLRNDIFHFKREVTTGELDTLRATRDWLVRASSGLEGRDG